MIGGITYTTSTFVRSCKHLLKIFFAKNFGYLKKGFYGELLFFPATFTLAQWWPQRVEMAINLPHMHGCEVVIKQEMYFFEQTYACVKWHAETYNNNNNAEQLNPLSSDRLVKDNILLLKLQNDSCIMSLCTEPE